MPLPDLLRLLALLRREHGVQRTPGAGDNGIELGLNLPPHGADRTPLLVHNRVDPGLLLRCQPDFPGKPISEFAIPWRAAVGPAGTVCPALQQLRGRNPPGSRQPADLHASDAVGVRERGPLHSAQPA